MTANLELDVNVNMTEYPKALVSRENQDSIAERGSRMRRFQL